MRCLTVLVASMQFVLLYARPAVPEWLRIASRRNDREEVPSSQGADEDRLAMYIFAVNNATITDISTRKLGPLNAPTYVRQCSRRRNGCVLALTTHTRTHRQLSDVTIQFQTGPNLRELDVAALCTRRGEGCAGTPLGDGAVDVSLPKTVAKQTVEVEVTNIDVTETDDALIDCYIRLTENPGLLASVKPDICWDAAVQGRDGPCSGDVQADGTAWVLSCGVASCTATCERNGT